MRKWICLFLDIVIILLTIVGTVLMIRNVSNTTGLMSTGLENLKYYTVLSNELCGIVAILWLAFYKVTNGDKSNKARKFMVFLKLTAASAVGVTFAVIAFFLGPIYGHMKLYQGSNLIFHLILPLVAMVEFALLDAGEIPFKWTLFASITSVLYGLGYIINILINGVGEWPDTNDWYGFLNWGYAVGAGIFVGIILFTWALACLLRFINLLIYKKKKTN